jgi:DNA-directed RNA polymerase subunit RPC12/RpoP
MKKESDKEEVSKEEEKKKEVRNLISCSNCGSHYVYVLKDGTIICRRCSHKTLSKK